MKLFLTIFIFIHLFSVSLALLKGSSCGVSSIYYPVTGPKAPLLSYSAVDSNKKYEFTVINKKNKNNFKVLGEIVFTGKIFDLER